MVSKQAKRHTSKVRKQRADEADYRSRVKYRSMTIPGSQPFKDKQTGKTVQPEPVVFTIIGIVDGPPEVMGHDWLGSKLAKPPALCPLEQGRAKDECEYCESEGNFGPNHPQYKRLYMVYVHSYEGKTLRTEDGKKKAWGTTRVLALPPGKDDKLHEKIDEAIEDGNIHKVVWQAYRVKGKGKGIVLKKLTKEARMEMHNKGIVPREALKEITDMDENTYYAHCLNIYRLVDWEWWDVEAPVVEAEEAQADEEDADENSYEDDDGESEEEDEAKSGSVKPAPRKSSKISRARDDEDEADEEEEEAPRSKKVAANKPPAKKPRRVVEDDGDDDDRLSDEVDDEDEEDEEPPRRKKKSR